MPQPCDVLLVDVPGLTVADAQHFGPRTPTLCALSLESCAALVPVASGSATVRQASLATGLLPMHHGSVWNEPLRAPTFWQRARALRPGLRAGFKGSSAMLAMTADLISPTHERALSECQVVWLELARPAAGPEGLEQLDAQMGMLLAKAGGRVVVVLASNAQGAAVSWFAPQRDLAEISRNDGRLLHVDCEPAEAETWAARLRAEPAFARIVHGAARGELGLNCPQAGHLIAELRPGWGFAGGPDIAGPDHLPLSMPVILARGLTIEKATVGMCEVAWLLQHALTGQEYRDAD